MPLKDRELRNAAERKRRRNFTPEQKEAERLRSRVRYSKTKQNPEGLEALRKRARLASERRRRKLGTPLRFRTPEQLRQKRRAKEARYWRRSINRRLSMRLRSRIRLAIHGLDKAASTFSLIGCSIEELKVWLAGQFKLGMSWENFGRWHIDHRRPCASFDLSDPVQQRECFHFSNLQPLWAIDNLQKGARIKI